jgi:NADH:ubiquinone oxidoreductase subunit C
MDTQTALDQVASLLAPLDIPTSRPAPDRLEALVRPDDLHVAAATLHFARWGYLSAITGVDLPAPRPKGAGGAGAATPGAVPDQIEVLYHFCDGAAVVTLRVKVPYDQPQVPTLCDIIPSAALYERELEEMFGVVVDGTPLKGPLLLPDDWPAGVHPLRKSFKGLAQG